MINHPNVSFIDNKYGKEKYPNKVMIWVAISVRGISKPLFRPSKSEEVNSDIYINKYIASFHP